MRGYERQPAVAADEAPVGILLRGGLLGHADAPRRLPWSRLPFGQAQKGSAPAASLARQPVARTAPKGAIAGHAVPTLAPPVRRVHLLDACEPAIGAARRLLHLLHRPPRRRPRRQEVLRLLGGVAPFTQASRRLALWTQAGHRRVQLGGVGGHLLLRGGPLRRVAAVPEVQELGAGDVHVLHGGDDGLDLERLKRRDAADGIAGQPHDDCDAGVVDQPGQRCQAVTHSSDHLRVVAAQH
mmetsp:Transcript_11414/g.36427  ORF Transcript_11414/g.36427 Transcript_11414/m.36427 type:complete len:240 (-) Transcript_11414:759-1478(-)